MTFELEPKRPGIGIIHVEKMGGKGIPCKGDSMGDAWVLGKYGTVKEVQVVECGEYRLRESRKT